MSTHVLNSCDRRVYLPQNGFADSLNVSVAAALAMQTALLLYGSGAVGDLADGATRGERDALRGAWAAAVCRDPAQRKAVDAYLADDGAGVGPVLDDLRRADELRVHNGRASKDSRRRAEKERAAEERDRSGTT